MTTVYISLCFVRMALHKCNYPNMLQSAQSTRFAPSIDHDGELLYGNYCVLDTSNSWY